MTAPTPDAVECCASGSCEVCRPGRGGWIGWGAPPVIVDGARRGVPMTAPTPEQVDAVARAVPCRVCGAGPGRACRMCDADEVHSYRSLDAQTTLTTTDPAAQAALAASLPAEVMLAALVERGTLTERLGDFPVWGERERTARDAGLVLDDTPVRHVTGWQRMRRLVTPWQVTP